LRTAVHVYPYLHVCRVVSARVTADTGSAGVGDLEVDVKVAGRSVPVKTVDKRFRIFGVQFTPTVAARHLVSVYFAGQQLTGKFTGYASLWHGADGHWSEMPVKD